MLCSAVNGHVTESHCGMPTTSVNAGLLADSDHTIGGTSMEDDLDCFKHMASVSTTLSELDIAVAAAMRGTVGSSDLATSPQFVFCMMDSLQPTGVDLWASDANFMRRIFRESNDGQSSKAGAGQEANVSAVFGGQLQEIMRRLLSKMF